MTREKARRRVKVARVAEIPEGERKIVSIAHREIGLFNVQGTFCALRNVCPHRGAPVCLGRIRPQTESAAGPDFAFTREGEILKCPWHQWEFDIKTGQALHSAGLRIRTFRVEREDQDLWLCL